MQIYYFANEPTKHMNVEQTNSAFLSSRELFSYLEFDLPYQCEWFLKLLTTLSEPIPVESFVNCILSQSTLRDLMERLEIAYKHFELIDTILFYSSDSINDRVQPNVPFLYQQLRKIPKHSPYIIIKY